MALLDLSLVTQALIRTIEESVKASPAWNIANPLLVTPQAPDALKGPRTIGFYLYHLREAAHAKNQESPVPGGPRPVRFTPMGLDLYYVLSAHSDITELDKQVYAEQLMMGLAVKALRDNARLDDESTVGGSAIPVFPPELLGHDNRLRITLQPIPYDEAMQYWTAGQNALRLSAYYEVSATLLEPDTVTSKASRVLTYGVHTFLRGAPRLDGSRNDVSFVLPGETVPRTLALQPAEVTYGAAVTLFGSDLAGDSTALILGNRRFAAPVQVNAGAWAVAATGAQVQATVQTTAAAEDVLPGLYGATVVVTVRKQMPDGSTRDFDTRSNETPFTIVPLIDVPVPAPVGGLWTITGQRFDPALLPDEQLQMFLGTDRLTRVTAGTPAAGCFRVINASTIRFRLPAGIAAGTVLPLRLVVNGAESSPLWITAT